MDKNAIRRLWSKYILLLFVFPTANDAFGQHDEFRFIAIPMEVGPNVLTTPQDGLNMAVMIDSLYDLGLIEVLMAESPLDIDSFYTGVEYYFTNVSENYGYSMFSGSYLERKIVRRQRDLFRFCDTDYGMVPLLTKDGEDSVNYLPDGSTEFVFSDTRTYLSGQLLSEVRVVEQAIWNPEKQLYEYIPVAFCPIYRKKRSGDWEYGKLPALTHFWVPLKQLSAYASSCQWYNNLEKRLYSGFQYRQIPFESQVAPSYPVR